MKYKEKIMLMFDEVHEAQNWQNDLKLLYERGKKIFVLATGSSALLLHSNSDLASRWTLKKIFPFRFPEFILAKSWLKNPKQKIFLEKDLAEEISALLFYSPNFNTAKRIKSKEEQFIEYFEVVEKTLGEKLNQLLDDYISYHNIARFLPLSNKTLVMERVLALFEQVLLRDIPNMDINLLNVFNRILFRLALSDLVNFQTLSKEFRLPETEVENFIVTLNHAEILNVFLPHGGVRTKTGGSQKTFFMSPSLRRALFSRLYGDKLKIALRAKLYEDIVAMYLKRILKEGIVTFGFGKRKNPDFVIETMDSPVLMEIGINKTSSAQIRTFGNYRYGIILNAKINRFSIDEKNRILLMPLHWFLLI